MATPGHYTDYFLAVFTVGAFISRVLTAETVGTLGMTVGGQ